jgi:hypothetical protein
LERGVTVEQNPLSVPAHWALPILICNCLAHPPSVGEHPARTFGASRLEKPFGCGLSRRRRRIQRIGSKGFVKTATGGRGVWYDCAP